MRNIMIFAAVMVGLGVYMAQMADKMTPAPPRTPTPPRKAAVPRRRAPSGGRSLSIPRDARGHFQTDGRIDGQRIDFMVDTGASVVALNEKSAARFGLRPVAQRLQRHRHHRQRHHQGRAYAASRWSKSAASIVRDVDAMVLPDEALSENLLGLSFLSRLKRFEYANGKMVLEQ